MERVMFSHQRKAVEALRPTHALMVAKNLGKALVPSNDKGFTVDASSLLTAVNDVRDGYKCRTVRKELRRIGLIAQEAGDANDMIFIHCNDETVVKDMKDASSI